MQLLIDAGNTRIKWALTTAAAVPGVWQAFGSITHTELDQLKSAWSAQPIQQALISNVAGPVMATRLTESLSDVGLSGDAIRWFQSQPECGGVRNGYAQSGQLGCDRFASLVGARYRFPAQRLLIVTCGTATTIDALEADGRFIGGMIVPGLATMASSLAVNTAQLPAVDAMAIARVFADNTRDAIISGCLSAQVGAIMQAMAQRSDPPARCILSGGAAPFIAPYLPLPFDAVDNLVLLGLHASLSASISGVS